MLVFYEGADFEVGADPDLLSPDGGRARISVNAPTIGRRARQASKVCLPRYFYLP
jgi:hypothetical protein